MRSALSVSLLLACNLCLAGPYGDLKARLDRTTSTSEVIRLVSNSPEIAAQNDVRQSLGIAETDEAKSAAMLRAQVDLRAMAETRGREGESVTGAVKDIKRSPFYRDLGTDQKRNWLADALERIKNLHWQPEEQDSKIRGNSFLGPIFLVFGYGLLALGIGALVYFAVRHIRWQNTLKRKVKTVLEDDEPDRTLDEWLQLADHHAAAGRHREAVRALYLACLLKFDEADVARFNRGETNWEHLARIEGSDKLPADLDFRTATKRFDVIWYGHKTNGMPDVDQFRAWYRQIVATLTGATG